MGRLANRLLPVFVFLAFIKGAAYGQSEPNTSATDGDRSGSAVWLVSTSSRLFEMGLQDNDPYLILIAAKLQKRANLQQVPLAPEEGVAPPTEPVLVSWQGMLEIAVRVSGGNQLIEGLAEDIRLEKARGVRDGAVYSEATIEPRGKLHYRDLPFEGGQYAEVFSKGREKVNLDMFIFDGNGHMVCSQTDPSNVNQCGWTPSFTGPFTIVMENKSDISSDYVLTTN